MSPMGMKPSSTTVAAKSSESMNSMKALVTAAVDSSSSSRVYMCSYAQMVKSPDSTFSCVGSMPSTVRALTPSFSM